MIQKSFSPYSTHTFITFCFLFTISKSAFWFITALQLANSIKFSSTELEIMTKMTEHSRKYLIWLVGKYWLWTKKDSLTLELQWLSNNSKVPQWFEWQSKNKWLFFWPILKKQIFYADFGGFFYHRGTLIEDSNTQKVRQPTRKLK